MAEHLYNQPPVFENLCEAIRRLREEHKILKVFPIGKSVLGREINALSIGTPQNATLFVGATHGLEWLTELLLLRFCGELLSAMEQSAHLREIDVAKAMSRRSLVIIPCLNPDGIEIALRGREGAGQLGDYIEELSNGNLGGWQANARGVDINHNFNAGWDILRQLEINSGIEGPGPTRYGGPYPESEPETMAIVDFCRVYQIRQLYSFHSQGEEIYYRYGPNTPARSQLMAQILSSCSGYKVTHPKGTASHGGLKDWFIQETHRPGFTIEIGRGKNPLPVEDLEPTYNQLLEMLLMAVLL